MYNPSDLDKETPSGRINIVRLNLGDTRTPEEFSDEEIQYFLSEAGDNIYLAAIYGVDSMLARYSLEVDTEQDEALRTWYSQASEQLLRLRKQLEVKAKSLVPMSIVFKGLRKSDKVDTDSTTYFRVGQFDICR